MAMKNLIGAAIMMALATGKVFEKLPFYKMLKGMGMGARRISRSRYQPHQGPRECTRRRKQIEEGRLYR